MGEKYVLIVDDDKDIQAAIKIILEMHGYRVNCASNGQEALDIITRGPSPEVILLDLMMPVMDGFEFMHLMESGAISPKVPIVVMTAARNMAHEIKNYTTLLKPFDVNKLLSILGDQYQISQ